MPTTPAHRPAAAQALSVPRNAPANLAASTAALNARLEAAQRQAMRNLFGAGSLLSLADYRTLCAIKLSRANSVKQSARLGTLAQFSALVAEGFLSLEGGLYTPTLKSNATLPAHLA